MKAQPHSWMQYYYRFNNANDNNKMWIRDDQRIHQQNDGTFITANSTVWHDAVYNSFAEAEKFLDQLGNDNE